VIRGPVVVCNEETSKDSPLPFPLLPVYLTLSDLRIHTFSRDSHSMSTRMGGGVVCFGEEKSWVGSEDLPRGALEAGCPSKSVRFQPGPVCSY
jgi:hypothetical protein